MNDQERATAIVHRMLDNDNFSRWLGLEVLTVAPGTVALRMTVRDDMLNGFGYCHGGVTFSLADSALAFAANSRGRVGVLLQGSMTFPEPVRSGDVLTATVEEHSLKDRVAVYTITVRKSDDLPVGIFKGTVYLTGKTHDVEPPQSPESPSA